MIEHEPCFLVLLLPVLLLAFVGQFLWLTWRQRCEARLRTTEEMLVQQLFRQWHNRTVEMVMIESLVELGWPKVVRKMTAEEVTRQLCNRLSDRI